MDSILIVGAAVMAGMVIGVGIAVLYWQWEERDDDRR